MPRSNTPLPCSTAPASPRTRSGRPRCSARAALRGSPIAQNRLARIFTIGRGAAANPVEAIKWHLISKAGGNSDPYLDKYAADQPDEVREAAQKAARPWLAALPPKS